MPKDEPYPEESKGTLIYEDAMTVLGKGHYCTIAVVHHEGRRLFNTAAFRPDIISMIDPLGNKRPIDPRFLSEQQRKEIAVWFCMRAHDQAEDQLAQGLVDPEKGSTGWINSDTNESINPDDFPDEEKK